MTARSVVNWFRETYAAAGLHGCSSHSGRRTFAGESSEFGGSLGVAAGSTNPGVIGPQAFYADTPIRLTANGASFTGGAIRIAIHYATVGVPPA